MTPDTSGPKFCEPFAWYDPDTQSLRTCEATLFLGNGVVPQQAAAALRVLMGQQ